MISCDLGQNHGSKKTDWLSGACSKVNIKSINKAKYLLFGTTEDRIPSFVTRISHEFTFVPWAVIWPTSRIWPFVNQFFCSLYVRRIWGWYIPACLDYLLLTHIRYYMFMQKENTKNSCLICQGSWCRFWGAHKQLWRGGQGSLSQTYSLWVLSNPLFLLTKACTDMPTPVKAKDTTIWGVSFRFTSTHTDSLDNTGVPCHSGHNNK